MNNLEKMILEAVESLIDRSDVEAALEDALENYDFTDYLREWASETLEQGRNTELIQQAVDKVADSLI